MNPVSGWGSARRVRSGIPLWRSRWSRNGDPREPKGSASQAGALPLSISRIFPWRSRTGRPPALGSWTGYLGSGIVRRSSLVLVGGDPGYRKIHPSSPGLPESVHGSEQKVLYISGEESLKQIKMRANRIGTITGELLFLCETNLDLIRGAIENEKPDDGDH